MKTWSRVRQVEERAEGRVARSVYMAYFSSWGALLLLPAVMLAFFTAERALQVLSGLIPEVRHVVEHFGYAYYGPKYSCL